MENQDREIKDIFADEISSWSKKWEFPDLADKAQSLISNRLHTSLAFSIPDKGIIRLNNEFGSGHGFE